MENIISKLQKGKRVKSEFRCSKCLKYKKPELYSYSYAGSNGAKRHVCTYCNGRIEEAKERIAKSFNIV